MGMTSLTVNPRLMTVEIVDQRGGASMSLTCDKERELGRRRRRSLYGWNSPSNLQKFRFPRCAKQQVQDLRQEGEQLGATSSGRGGVAYQCRRWTSGDLLRTFQLCSLVSEEQERWRARGSRGRQPQGRSLELELEGHLGSCALGELTAERATGVKDRGVESA